MLLIETKEGFRFWVDEYGTVAIVPSKEEAEKQIPEELIQEWLNVSITPRTGWAKQFLAEFSYPEYKDIGLTLEYTKDTDNPYDSESAAIWKQVRNDKLVITENGTYWFRLGNGFESTGKESYKRVEINQVDNIAPSEFEIDEDSISVTMNSITFGGSTEDLGATDNPQTGSGNVKYLYSINGGSNWYGIENEEIKENAWTADTTITFTGLSAGQTCNLKMKAKDAVGNERETSTVTWQTEPSYEYKVGDILPIVSAEGYDSVTRGTETYSKGVKVTAEARSGLLEKMTNNPSLNIRLTTDGTNYYDASTGINVTTEGVTVYAWVYEGDTRIESAVASIETTGVDLTGPTAVSISSIEPGEHELKVTGTATDAKAGGVQYQFSINGGSWVGATDSDVDGWTSNNSHTFTGLTPNTQYILKMRAKDALGNGPTETVPIIGTTTALPIASGHVTPQPQGWDTRNNPPLRIVEWTANEGYTGYYLQTSTDGQNWSPSKPFTNDNLGKVTGKVAAGGSLHVRFVDSNGNDTPDGYATYTQNEQYVCTVTYEPNGADKYNNGSSVVEIGTNKMADSTHTYGTNSNLSANAYVKTDYTFKGWSTTSGENNTVEFEPGAQVSSLTKGSEKDDGKLTLYAVWEYDYVNASDVNFEPADNSWNVNNVQDALDSLYGM